MIDKGAILKSIKVKVIYIVVIPELIDLTQVRTKESRGQISIGPTVYDSCELV